MSRHQDAFSYIRKIFCLSTYLLLSLFGSSQSWQIQRIIFHNFSTNKTTDSNAIGSISLDKNSPSFIFMENGKLNFFEFNHCRKITQTDSHSLEYRLDWIGFESRGNKRVTLICYDTSRLLNKYDAKLMLSVGASTKYYLLVKDDAGAGYDQTNYLNFIDTSFANIHFDWLFIGTDVDGTNYFVQSEPLENYQGIIKVWIDQQMKSYTYEHITYKNVEQRTLFSFNCSQKKVFIHEFYYYDKNGHVINSVTDDNGSWDNVVPGSVGDNMLKKVCELFNKPKSY